MTTPNRLRTNLKNSLLHTAMDLPAFAQKARLHWRAVGRFLDDTRTRATDKRTLAKIERTMLELGWINAEAPQISMEDIHADEPNPPILLEPLLLSKEERRYVLRAVCRMDHAENIQEALIDKLIP